LFIDVYQVQNKITCELCTLRFIAVMTTMLFCIYCGLILVQDNEINCSVDELLQPISAEDSCWSLCVFAMQCWFYVVTCGSVMPQVLTLWPATAG